MKFIFFILLTFDVSAFAQTKESYRKVIRDHINDFSDCLILEKTNHKSSNTITVSWQIDDIGSVRKAEKKRSTFNNQFVDSCIIEKLKKINFPPAPKDQLINIVYPIVIKKLD